MKKLITAIAIAALSWGLAGTAAAVGTSDNHSVTIQIPEIHLVDLNGGDVTINIQVPGDIQNPQIETDNSSTLRWITNARSGSPKKITAALDSDMPTGVTLKVEVNTSGSNGSSSQQTLSATAVDVVTGIYAEVYLNGTLTYEATVTVAADPDDDPTRTVTYTITD